MSRQCRGVGPRRPVVVPFALFAERPVVIRVPRVPCSPQRACDGATHHPVPLARAPAQHSTNAIVSPAAPRTRTPIPHVLVVEDQADLAFGLQRALEARGHRVSLAADGPAALTQATREPPALVVLDVMMPHLDGFGVLERLRAAGHRMPALILSARSDERDKVRGFRLGADDYVTKPFGLLELLERVDALLRRASPPASAPVAPHFGEISIDPLAQVVQRAGQPVALTPMEFALLLAFVQQPGVALSRADLLRDVWGHAADVKTRTVDLHVAELRRKLEPVPAAPRHFVTVWKTGYRFVP
jgi:DNA-binding response OmpR family regulator